MTLADRLIEQGFALGRRAVGYGRISDDAKDQITSLRNQIDYFGFFFEESGFTAATDCGIYHKRDGTKEPLQSIYADEGISGVSLRRREAYKLMIEDAKKGLFDVIIVKSIQRFSRDVEITYPLLKDLAEKGVAVYFIDSDLCSKNPADDSKILNGLTAAQDESTHKSRNVQFSLRLLQKKAKWTSRVPLGYNRKRGFLENDVYEQCIVKEIAYLFEAEKFGGKKIINELESFGFLTKAGSPNWNHVAVYNIIDNPIYTGLQVQHMSRMVDLNRNRRVKVDPSKWIITYRPELAIYDFEYFNRLQVERHRRGSSPDYLQIVVVDGEPKIKLVSAPPAKERKRHSSKHVFSNLLVCGNCGSTLHRKKRETKTPSYSWVCSLYNSKGKVGCKYPNTVHEDEFLQYVKQQVAEFRSNKSDRIWHLEAFLKTQFKEVDQQRLNELDESIAKVEKRFNDTLDQMSDGIVPKNVLQKRIESLKDELDTLQDEQRSIRNREQGIDKVRQRFDEFMGFLDTLDLDDLTNATLRPTIHRITITTDEMKLKRGEDARDINITWKLLDAIEDDIVWEYLSVEAEEWKTKVWYKDWTPEEIAEEEERIAMRDAWEQTPEGQQYLREQDELRQEIFEHEQLTMEARS